LSNLRNSSLEVSFQLFNLFTLQINRAQKMLDEDKSEFSKMENEEADTDVEDQVSISSTLNVRIFRTNVVFLVMVRLC